MEAVRKFTCGSRNQLNIHSKILVDPVRHCETSRWASPCYYFHPSLSLSLSIIILSLSLSSLLSLILQQLTPEENVNVIDEEGGEKEASRHSAPLHSATPAAAFERAR